MDMIDFFIQDNSDQTTYYETLYIRAV